MKLISRAILLSFLVFSASTAYAQSDDIKIGGGIILGTGVSGIDQVDNNFGLKVDGIYTINEEFRAGADFGFYFPHEESGFKQTVWELNFNGNYIFHNQDALLLYGLGGINITNISFDQSNNQGFNVSGSDSEFGLNIGGGLEYGLDFGDLFAELKYVLSDADQLVLGTGVRFDI
ncbi:porin family protein [Aliifodinibius sp. S!AR15-10]|uniref:outer membrane protein n=1 Tax=Aliifodinibius sp. S!AR15-10 TaxID=2950437 RepID=UPI002854DCB0|nr:outer membrane beta-barrel protein [Aliifodinibius sp. S!AR15-10]MDR8393935.1 porin family protein [Aliifodinibius sp. S!AR15-10]